ncbi:MAG: TVP38/TMEM64 family protein [Alphaproteobacteria bacterium]
MAQTLGGRSRPVTGAAERGTAEVAENGHRAGRAAWRYLPLVLIVAAFGAFFLFDLDRYLSFEELRRHRETLGALVRDHAVLAALGFIVVYAVSTAVSLPGGAILTLAGGFLFGVVAGSIYVVIGATVGATALFLAARSALGDMLQRRAGPSVRRMERGFRDNALSYLLFLRLVPVFPFWLVNLVPAFLAVPLRTYVIGTFFGIIPGSIVYAAVGNGLGAVFDQGRTPDLSIIFKPEILLPILGLAVLSLVPVVYKAIKGKALPGNGGEEDEGVP